MSASPDELCCGFHGTDAEPTTFIYATIPANYPHSAPLWFTETENIVVSEAINRLCDASPDNNRICKQVYLLVSELFDISGLPEPKELIDIKIHLEAKGDSLYMNVMEDEEGLDLAEDDFHYETDKKPFNVGEMKKELDGVHPQTLQKVEQSQETTAKGATSGSARATDRLMKELKEIHESQSFKDGMFDVEVVDDNLYEWNIKLKKLDSDSELYGDLSKYKDISGKDHILLNIEYKDTFPFEPPFIRVVYPVLKGENMLDGGAFCMELLTKQGWSAACSVEALIIQLSATVAHSTRIDFSDAHNSKKRAHRSFDLAEKGHQFFGYSSKKSDS